MAKQSTDGVSVEIQIDVLKEEYRAMYQLAGHRITSLDRRVPVAATGIVALLSALVILPDEARLAALWTLPIVLVWLLRTTINHARSFEDAIRRIDQIEQQINGLAGAELMRFQSRHPSKDWGVGGRTGLEAIGAIYVLSLASLGVAAWLTGHLLAGGTEVSLLLAVMGIAASYLSLLFLHAWRYRYRPLYTKGIKFRTSA